MTDARRKAKIRLLELGLTFDDLARESRLAKATIHNVLDDKASSAKSKQAITNALRAEIWPGVYVNEGIMPFPAGFVLWPTEKHAADFLELVGSAGTAVRKNLVKLHSEVRLRATFDTSKPPLTQAQRDPNAPVITFYDAESEAEAVADAEAQFSGATSAEDTTHERRAGASSKVRR